MIKRLKTFIKRQSGQAMVEYVVLIAVVSIVAVFSLGSVGNSIKDKFEETETIVGTTDPNGDGGLYTYEYSDDDGGYIITGFKYRAPGMDGVGGGTGGHENNPTDIVIPSMYDGPKGLKPIIGVGNRAFHDSNLNSVILPPTLKWIGDSAFSYNGISTIDIPEGVVSIGWRAFMLNQINSATLPSTLQNLDGYSFERNQLTSIEIPDGILEIKDNTFGFNPMESVSIPSNVTVIGDQAFYQTNLTSVALPSKLTTIGEEAFAYSQLQSVVIPNDVTDIKKRAFLLTQLKSVTLSNSIVNIGESAFYGNQLEQVIIPSSTKTIGESAFYSNKLTFISIPKSVTSMGRTAFNNNNLNDSQAFIYSRTASGDDDKTTIVSYGGSNKNITIPDSVKTIEINAFSDNSLESVIIPHNLTSIGSFAFNRNNITSVTLPSNVGMMGHYPFRYNGPNQKSNDIPWDGNNVLGTWVLADGSNDWTKVGGLDTSEPEYFKFEYDNDSDSYALKGFHDDLPPNQRPRKIIIPATHDDGVHGEKPVTIISSKAFNQRQLTEVIIPESVTKIDREAFFGNKLTSITIPKSVTHIESQAFRGNNLTSVVIEDDSILENIGFSAFGANGPSKASNNIPDTQPIGPWTGTWTLQNDLWVKQ